MTTVRRFAVIVALMFWQGGFTFYAAVVVPVGTDVLGSPAAQGWITRRVTDALNLAGLVAVAVLAWDLARGADAGRRRRLRWLCWGLLAATQAALFWLHGRLDDFLDLDNLVVLDHAAFRPLHRLYLWLHTVQWAAGLAFLALTLRAWQQADQGGRQTAGVSPE